MIKSPTRFLVSSLLLLVVVAVITNIVHEIANAIQTLKDDKVELIIRRHLDALTVAMHNEVSSSDDKE